MARPLHRDCTSLCVRCMCKRTEYTLFRNRFLVNAYRYAMTLKATQESCEMPSKECVWHNRTCTAFDNISFFSFPRITNSVCITLVFPNDSVYFKRHSLQYGFDCRAAMQLQISCCDCECEHLSASVINRLFIASDKCLFYAMHCVIVCLN